MAKEGIPFVVGSFFLGLLVFIAGTKLISDALGLALSSPFLLGSIFFLWFFRDPERKPEGEGILSPADGKVILIDEVDSPYNLEGKFKRIAIFMSPLDVHINRSPDNAKVIKIQRFKGGFARAFLKHSEHNSRVAWLLENEKGEKILVVQIAGALARRIRVWKKEGEKIKKGEKIGMIMFGSRVDLYLPQHYKIKIKEGDKVFAGHTVVAEP